ncbi:hypothetical protein LTR78_004980 [Recurvomyces mirabilis]|uniref:Uncharacterized protein n=1 Tax=Recurvomyces mirabilis TaxID=574656 RepID=A0AAE1C1Z2_9PEZI|nr:hypothetical protein LTR78_004980 [Recurvomyces mirabilis]KAK5158404.1 hypothetical protein LTS14_003422 [Recurvomyces mirabilis]
MAASCMVWTAAILKIHEIALPVDKEANTLHAVMQHAIHVRGLPPRPHALAVKNLHGIVVSPPNVSMLDMNHIPEDIDSLKEGFIAVTTNWRYKEVLASNLRRLLASLTTVDHYLRQADHGLFVQRVSAAGNDQLLGNIHPSSTRHLPGNGLPQNSGIAQSDGANDQALGDGHSLDNGQNVGSSQALSNGHVHINGQAYDSGHTVGVGHTASSSQALSSAHAQSNGNGNGP